MARDGQGYPRRRRDMMMMMMITGLVFWSGFGDLFASQNPREFNAPHSLRMDYGLYFW